jgi:predicted ester cyclase
MTALPVRRRSPVARSPVPLVVAGFAMLTALVLAQLGGAAMALRPNATSIASDPTAAATRAAVERFYAAVNLVLATGDAAPLDAASDPAFIDHVAASSQARDRPAFITDLLAQRRAEPDLQFDVAAVLVDGDQALAYVQADPFAETAARQPTTLEALRVRGGVVVERWSDRLGTATVVPKPQSEVGSVGGVGGAVWHGEGTSAGQMPTPAERWSGDAVWAATATPATAMPPERSPRIST